MKKVLFLITVLVTGAIGNAILKLHGVNSNLVYGAFVVLFAVSSVIAYDGKAINSDKKVRKVFEYFLSFSITSAISTAFYFIFPMLLSVNQTLETRIFIIDLVFLLGCNTIVDLNKAKLFSMLAN